MKYLFYINLILWVVAGACISFSAYVTTCEKKIMIDEIQKLEYKITQAELKAEKLEEQAVILDLTIKAILDSKHAN